MLRVLFALLLLSACAEYKSFQFPREEPPSMLSPSGVRFTVAELLRDKQFPPECAMAGEGSVVCYMPRTREMYLLQGGENAVATQLLITLPASDPSPYTGYVRSYVWDLAAQEDGAGNLLLCWRYDRNHAQSLNVLRVNAKGEVNHRVVKQFAPFEPFFNLQMFVVEPGFIQFFYTNYSEKHFSPVSDTGSIEKLWTLGFRDDHVVFDVQLSESGRAHTTYYDAWHRGQGQFDVVWTERRIGSFFGPGTRLKLGRTVDNREGPRLQVSAEMPMAPWEDKGRLIQPKAAPNARDGIKAIAEISGTKEGTVYLQIDSSAKVMGQVIIGSGEVTSPVYDPRTGLFRYVKGSLRGSLRAQPMLNAQVHWTDLRGGEWVTPLQALVGSIFPNQGAGDCFRWLQPERETFLLVKKCRESARATTGR